MHHCTAAESIGTLPATARAALRLLLLRGPLPRAELARLLDLSPASLTKATRELLERGLITAEKAEAEEARGRPGVPLALVAHRCQFVGIKITIDAVFAVRVDALGGVLESRQRDLDDTAVEHVLDHIVHLVNIMAEGHPVQAVGVGSAGAMALFDDHVRQNRYFDWDRVPLSRLVEQACGLPVVISRDVAALTAGVQWWGPGRGLADLAVLTIGVGVGVGLVLEGRVLSGSRGAAGMAGHTRIDPSGPYCDQGHRGCATAYLTTAAITGAVGMRHGEATMTLARVCELADHGDPTALAVVGEAGRALGVMIAGMVDLLDLPVVILTGDGLPVLQRVGPSLQENLRKRLDPEAYVPRVQVYQSGFDEWARGAAAVACQWLLAEPPALSRLGSLDAVPEGPVTTEPIPI